MELNEIIEQRKAKFNSLQAKGIAIYDRALPLRIDIGEALNNFEAGKKMSFCGRIMARRSHGKATFLDLRDSTGKIQLYLKEDIVGQDRFSVFEDIDIADIISVRGELFKTHTNEPTLKVEEFVILAK